MIADPRAVAMRWPDARLRAIATLAMQVTETPWCARWPAALDDDTVVHVVALSAYFGHLNRVADAVGVPLDYDVKYPAPEAVPSTPRYARAPAAAALAGPLRIDRRPATAAALAAWRDYVMQRDAPLSRDDRARIAAHVLTAVGASGGEPPTMGDAQPAVGALGALGALAELADVVTLAPWALGPDAFAALRARGADDAYVFDAVVVASTAGMLGRIAVALASLTA